MDLHTKPAASGASLQSSPPTAAATAVKTKAEATTSNLRSNFVSYSVQQFSNEATPVSQYATIIINLSRHFYFHTEDVLDFSIFISSLRMVNNYEHLQLR